MYDVLCLFKHLSLSVFTGSDKDAQPGSQLANTNITGGLSRQTYMHVHICSPVGHMSWIASSELIVKPDESMSCAYQWSPLNTCHPSGISLTMRVIVSRQQSG